MNKEKLKIKIGRNEYVITSVDQFMDNGACVQLLTQSKDRSVLGSRPTLQLSQKAIKQINKYDHSLRKHKFGEDVKVFSLKF